MNGSSALALFYFILGLFGSIQVIQAYVEDAEIAASIAEGQRLMSEINQLMSGSDLSSSDKQRLRSALNNMAGGSAIVQDLPMTTSLGRHSAGTSSRIYGIQASVPAVMSCPNEKRCCKVTIPPVTRSRTTTRSYWCCRYSTSYYRVSCGSWGQTTCLRSTRQRNYRQCYTSYTTYYSEAQSCPANYHTCCKGSFLHRDCCINVAQLRAILANARARG